jgi:hypothetical protein
MLQQAQASQANGVPFNIAAFQQRLLAAARQGQPNAAAALQGQLPGLFRPQDMNQAAALAGLAGQMPPPNYNQQVPFKFMPCAGVAQPCAAQPRLLCPVPQAQCRDDAGTQADLCMC